LPGLTLMHANNFSGCPRAASTAATERGRPAASGTTVPGNSVVFCKGSTAISKGCAAGGVGCADSVSAVVGIF
jgi:hypothetical protein